MSSPQDDTAPNSAGWRFKLGIVIICLILGSWLLVPLAAAADVPGPKIAALTGTVSYTHLTLPTNREV